MIIKSMSSIKNNAFSAFLILKVNNLTRQFWLSLQMGFLLQRHYFLPNKLYANIANFKYMSDLKYKDGEGGEQWKPQLEDRLSCIHQDNYNTHNRVNTFSKDLTRYSDLKPTKLSHNEKTPSALEHLGLIWIKASGWKFLKHRFESYLGCPAQPAPWAQRMLWATHAYLMLVYRRYLPRKALERKSPVHIVYETSFVLNLVLFSLDES